jgi:hypothetical protein
MGSLDSCPDDSQLYLTYTVPRLSFLTVLVLP